MSDIEHAREALQKEMETCEERFEQIIDAIGKLTELVLKIDDTLHGLGLYQKYQAKKKAEKIYKKIQ